MWNSKPPLVSSSAWTEGTQRHVGTYNVRVDWELTEQIELWLFATREFDAVKLTWGYEELVGDLWVQMNTGSWPWEELNTNAALTTQDPLLQTMLLDEVRTETWKLGREIERRLTDLAFDGSNSEYELRAWVQALPREARDVDR